MDKKHFTILLVSIILAIFVSVFFSFWFFVGRQTPHFPQPFMDENLISQPPIIDNNGAFRQMNEMMQKQQEDFDAMQRHMLNFKPVSPNDVAIKTEELKDSYRIVVNLKPFNNDPKNVKVEVKGDSINVSAKYESKDKKQFNSSQISQSITLPFKFDKKTIEQKQEGNILVIKIPKKDK